MTNTFSPAGNHFVGSKKPSIIFLALMSLILLLLYMSFWIVMESRSYKDYYSYTIIIPLISLYFGLNLRSNILSRQAICLRYGLPIFLLGVLIYTFNKLDLVRLTPIDSVVFVITGLIIALLGSFITCYGIESFKISSFPLFFLFFSIPLPDLLQTRVIHLLQSGSACLVNAFLEIAGVPFTRDGVFFTLPTVQIEIAQQCSGIRSSIVLIITGILCAKLFLNHSWSRFVLLVTLVPLAIFKNALRITTLTLFGAYVDERYLKGSALHSSGGYLFFLLTLFALTGILWLLRTAEKRSTGRKEAMKANGGIAQ